MQQPDDDFKIWVERQPRGVGQLGFRGAWLKNGPQRAKVVTVADFGDPATGTLSKRELCFRTLQRLGSGGGYDFDHPIIRWACENDEVEKLLAFLHANVAATGRYRVMDTNSPLACLKEFTDRGEIDITDALQALVGQSDLVHALASTNRGLSAAEGAVISKRRELVALLSKMAGTPATTETELHRSIGDAYWLFGGRYIGVADRRNLVPLDQHDIPLLSADGALHIIELKGSYIPNLVRKHRNHYIVGAEVHEATSQAMNYLRGLDEMGPSLTTTYRNDLCIDYDMRRAFATVVIGHPAHLGIRKHIVSQTLRSYNAHLSRVEVVTYASLFEAAARALAFEETTRTEHAEDHLLGDDRQLGSNPTSQRDDAPPF